jgi:dihydrofolate reductase
MQRVTYLVATSIDGAIARADGTHDFFPREGEHIEAYLAMLRSFDAVVMGRRTYEVGTKVDVHDPYPWLRTYVASRTLPPSAHDNVTIVGDGAVDLVRQLRAEEGRGIYLCGGGELAATLIAEGMVDEIVLKLSPVLAGGGIPLVAPMDSPTRLELVDLKRFDSGVVFLRYRVRG